MGHVTILWCLEVGQYARVQRHVDFSPLSLNINWTHGVERGWKIPHGFFAQMGGFLLHDADGKPLHVVWSKDVCAMLRSPLIEPPRLTEDELEDRSKSDIVAKLYALVQTISFFAQCITRLAKRLPITELELITFTYTIVNVYVYFVFFQKPQNVGYQFPVYEKTVANGGRKRIREHSPMIHKSVGRKLMSYLKLASLAPFYGVNAWAINQEDRGVQVMAVPDLYYHGQKRISSGRVLALAAFMGAVFGASHLIAWNAKLGYPSFAQEIAWRVSCIALTVIPPILLVLILISTSYADTVPEILVTISASLAGPLMMFLYIVARLSLLGLPLAALSNLPPEVFIATPLPGPLKYLGNWQA
ncbi:hypothetical protein J132_08263 [Termitomyces sp. J132]|nr:hypothetical protein J132_08263 [Termitomyces sp. J132]